MRRAFLAFALTCAALLAPVCAALAQPTTLVADSIRFDTDEDNVIAEGNVEIFHDGQRIKSDRVIYNQATDTVTFDGEVTMHDEGDEGIVVADAAELSDGFKQAVIQGARLLIGEQLQVAAVELHRAEGRYNQAYKAVASTCRVCGTNKPLWQIRARSIAHDEEKKQLYFDRAVFELGGVPVMYFPKLRMPDPTLRRATGFLIPEWRNSDVLGMGLKFPYFVVLGDHQDLRLTPYISPKTRTFEARYRRAFTFGDLTVSGAVSQDNLTTDPYRAYLALDGNFDLPRDFKMQLDLNWVSTPDNAYLVTYNYPAPGRLRNGVDIFRTKRHEHIAFEIQHLETLIAGEAPYRDTLPSLLGRASYERRLDMPWIGGETRLTFDIEGHERKASTVTAALATACTNNSVATADCTGRDLLRAGAAAEWRRSWTLRNGLQAAVDGALATDFYWINEDPNYSEYLAHVTPTATAELRWPFARTGPKGARTIIEPMLQLAWTDAFGANVPNEDSQLVEFDEGNLLSLSRFPGSDRYERGWRSTLGLNFSHLTPGGNQYNATVGRVIRLDDKGQFSRASGLDGPVSDWLLATQLKMRSFTVTNRSLFDNTLAFAKSETQVAWNSDKLTAAASYVWVVDDPTEGRTGNTNEVNFSSTYQVTDYWAVGVGGRYDGRTQEATDGSLQITYSNECLYMNLSASRRFAGANNVTEYGLAVGLNGFGESNRGPTRSCRG